MDLSDQKSIFDGATTAACLMSLTNKIKATKETEALPPTMEKPPIEIHPFLGPPDDSEWTGSSAALQGQYMSQTSLSTVCLEAGYSRCFFNSSTFI